MRPGAELGPLRATLMIRPFPGTGAMAVGPARRGRYRGRHKTQYGATAPVHSPLRPVDLRRSDAPVLTPSAVRELVVPRGFPAHVNAAQRRSPLHDRALQPDRQDDGARRGWPGCASRNGTRLSAGPLFAAYDAAIGREAKSQVTGLALKPRPSGSSGSGRSRCPGCRQE